MASSSKLQAIQRIGGLFPKMNSSQILENKKGTKDELEKAQLRRIMT